MLNLFLLISIALSLTFMLKYSGIVKFKLFPLLAVVIAVILAVSFAGLNCFAIIFSGIFSGVFDYIIECRLN